MSNVIIKWISLYLCINASVCFKNIKNDFACCFVQLDTKEQLKNISQLKVYHYSYNEEFAEFAGLSEDELNDTGVIAQDVGRILPDAVRETGDIVLPSGERIDNFLVVNKVNFENCLVDFFIFFRYLQIMELKFICEFFVNPSFQILNIWNIYLVDFISPQGAVIRVGCNLRQQEM